MTWFVGACVRKACLENVTIELNLKGKLAESQMLGVDNLLDFCSIGYLCLFVFNFILFLDLDFSHSL